MTSQKSVVGRRSAGRFSSTKIPSLRQAIGQAVVAQEQLGESVAQFRFIVGRVGEDQIVRLGRAGVVEKIKNVLFSDPSAQAGLREVAFDRADGMAVVLDEHDGRGAAAECFDAKRPGAGEEIKDARADNARAETRENGGFHTIHRWPNVGLGNDEPDAAGGPGDDSHGEGTGVTEGSGAISSGVAGATGSGETSAGVASLGEAVGVGEGVTASAGFFFFFAWPKRLLITPPRSRRSRPTSLSMRSVFGRSTVPLTLKVDRGVTRRLLERLENSPGLE